MKFRINHQILQHGILPVVFLLLFVTASNAQEAQVLFSESFDNKIFPPKNWQIEQSNTNFTWERNNNPDKPFTAINSDNQASACCSWSHLFSNEWLVSPQIITNDAKSLTLIFYAGFKNQWLSYANLYLRIRSDQKKSWLETDTIWSADTDTTLANSWEWRFFEIDMTDYLNDTVQLAWQYFGSNGDLVSIDNIQIVDGYEYTKNEILSFQLPEQTHEAYINKTSHTVQVEVSFDAPVDNIIPSIEVSPGATIEPASGIPRSFLIEDTVNYLVTAANGEIQKWNIVVDRRDYETDILEFTLPTQTDSAEINYTSHTVTIEVEYETDFENIRPEIVVSDGATIDPPSGKAQSFEEGVPLQYTVTAHDTAITQDWRVIVNRIEVKNGTDIISFQVADQVSKTTIDTVNHTISVDVAFDAGLNNVIPTMEVSPEAKIEPSKGTAVNFENGIPKIFTVTASNPTISPQQWEVTLTKLDYLTDIESFMLTDESGKAITDDIIIDYENHSIAVVVEYGVNLVNIIPVIEVSDGASVTPASGTPQTFYEKTPVYYTVTAANPEYQQKWEVVVTRAVLNENFDNPNFPPDGWTLITTNDSATWQKNELNALPFTEYDSNTLYSAVCPWSDNFQDEWLISPKLTTDGLSGLSMAFYTVFNETYIDSAAIKAYISTDNKFTWTQIWNIGDDLKETNELQWRQIKPLDLSEFVGNDIFIAWQYTGKWGDVAGIDNILLVEKTNENQEKAKSLIKKTTIHPNPCSDKLYINGTSGCRMQLFTVHGKILLEVPRIQRNNFILNLTDYNNGIYIIRLFNEHRSYSQTILVNKTF